MINERFLKYDCSTRQWYFKFRYMAKSGMTLIALCDLFQVCLDQRKRTIIGHEPRLRYKCLERWPKSFTRNSQNHFFIWGRQKSLNIPKHFLNILPQL